MHDSNMASVAEMSRSDQLRQALERWGVRLILVGIYAMALATNRPLSIRRFAGITVEFLVGMTILLWGQRRFGKTQGDNRKDN